jgi:putative peptide zinc metalloprotease protein
MIAANQQDSVTERKLPLRMRRDLSVHPLRFAGRWYWGIKDPVSLRYFQLRDEEYAILRMLDGGTSLDEIKEQFEEQFAPLRVEVQQLQAFLGTLHRQGLIVADGTGQGARLLERRREERRRQLGAALSNVLAIRFRGIDPEPLLLWLYPKCRWLFSVWAVAASLLLALAALTLLAVQFETMQAKLPQFHAFFNAQNAVWIVAALAVTKVLHELGHGLACRHFGGECHELGVMLLVFTPCLYCNVSDAWMLPNKWHRVAIGAAGMYVELILAAVCTLLWWFSEPGLLNALCLNTMFICSVSTLLFNGNPLLRYDGYYILSDVLEVPNLGQQSTALIRRVLARWLAGVDLGSERMFPDRRRGLLVLYAVASTVYRWLIVGVILWFCYQVLKPYGLQSLAQLLAVVVIGGMIVMPLVQAVGFLRDPRRNREVNWIRVAFWSVIVASLIVAACLVPLPHRVAAPALLQPQDARRVYVSVPGTLVESRRAGDVVKQGETLAKLENLNVQRELVELEGQRDRQRLHLQNLKRRQADPQAAAQIPTAEQALADLEQRLQQRLADADRLTLTAPIDGVVMPPRPQLKQPTIGELPSWSGTPLDEANLGASLETGTMYCLIGDPARLEAVLVIDQADLEFVRQGQRVRVTLGQLPGETLWGTIEEISENDLKVAPRELAAAKQLPTVTDPNGIARPLSASYQARVVLDEHPHALLLSAPGSAKIHVAPQALGKRLYRYLSSTFRFEL